MLSLAEYFQAFDSYAVEHELSANSRTLYYTILGMFNEKYWKADNVSISVRDMQIRGGFQSSSAVERAKTVLGTENIVKIGKLKNRKTQYSLVNPEYWLRNQSKRNTNDAPKVQLQNTCDTSPFIKYTHNAGVKDKKDKEDGGTPARERTAPAADSDKFCSAALKNAWITHSGMNPNDGICMKLGALEQTYGTEKVKVAIEEANARNQSGTINFNFVQSVLMRMINGTLTKGEMPSGKITRNDRKSEKDYDWDKNMPDLSKYEV